MTESRGVGLKELEKYTKEVRRTNMRREGQRRGKDREKHINVGRSIH
jgi:hypothetical protein